MNPSWSDFATFQRHLNRNIDTYGTLTVLLMIGNVFLLGVVYVDLTAEIQNTSITIPLLLSTLIINIWSGLGLTSALQQRTTPYSSTAPRSPQKRDDHEPRSPNTTTGATPRTYHD